MKINSLTLLFTYLVFTTFSLHPVFSQNSIPNAGESLQISGHYSHVFSNGAPPKTNNYNFIAHTAANGWKIAATNANQPKEWGIMRYDGTNIYTLLTDPLNAYKIFGYVYPGEFYVPVTANDSVKPFFPWMVFCLKPRMIQNFERDGVVDIPSPWGSRLSLFDYGFKWKTRYFENDRVIKRIDVVRDSALDLKTEEDELRRANVDYPFSYSARDRRLDLLHLRKDIPKGFVHFAYECEDFYQTNDWLIPSAAQFAEYWPNFKNLHGPSRLVFQMVLQVDEIKLLQNAEITEAIPSAQASVYDYRYQATNSRTKFNRATYKLNSGDSFPSGKDPKLVAQAEEWLRHGESYGGLKSKRTKILVGMLTVTLIISGWLVFWLIRKNKQTQTK